MPQLPTARGTAPIGPILWWPAEKTVIAPEALPEEILRRSLAPLPDRLGMPGLETKPATRPNGFDYRRQQQRGVSRLPGGETVRRYSSGDDHQPREGRKAEGHGPKPAMTTLS